MQVSEKEGEPEPVWNQAVSFFYEPGFQGLLVKSGYPTLIFFGLQPLHVPFWTECKHKKDKTHESFQLLLQPSSVWHAFLGGC